MATSFRQKLFFFLIPGGLLTAIAALLALRVAPAPPLGYFLPFLPPLVAAAGLFFGWRFNRSRLLFVLAVLVLADRALALYPGEPAVTLTVAALLPLNLALIAAYRERGVITPRGLCRLGLIAAQAATAAWLWKNAPDPLLAALGRPLISSPLFDRLPATLPQPLLAVLLLAALLLLAVFLRRPGPLEGGFFWALVVAVAPVLLGMQGFSLTLGFTTAGLILLAAVIETSHRLAFRDELTGLPARRALNEALLKVGRRYTVAMVDVDHFKKVNDRHGHDIGDQVLKMVASRLAQVRGGGVAFRYGGEEFTVLFPGKGVGEALPHLERLREGIEASAFTLRHKSRPKNQPAKAPKQVGRNRLAVTVSIGAAERGGTATRSEAVVKAADQALYRAKHSGRNRICGKGVPAVAKSRSKS